MRASIGKNCEGHTAAAANLVFIAIAVVISAVVYVLIMGYSEKDSTTEESEDEFARIEVTIVNSLLGDKIIINHTGGEPFNWADYRIEITNQSDDSQKAVMQNLTGELSFIEQIVLNTTNAPGFDGIDYNGDNLYKMEIYRIQDNKRVFEKTDILCTG